MFIEEKIFKHTIIDLNRLTKYGFTESDGKWSYNELFMNGDFKAVITITPQGNVSGRVIEIATGDDFLPLRIENIEGFAGKIRAEYQKILENIKTKCCHINYFLHPQTNRITQKIFETYGDNPVFPWEKYTDFGVFKNPDSQKWYALIMTIDWSKLDKNLSGKIEAVNIKLDEAKIQKLQKQIGFYPAYHMNKNNWITIVLNDTVPDDVVFELLKESHIFTVGKHKRNQPVRSNIS